MPDKPEAEDRRLEPARALAEQAAQYQAQGDYATAQACLEDALALQEKVLGESHLAHARLLRALVQVHRAQGHQRAVLPLVQRLAELYRQVLGPDHPETLSALGELMGQTSYEAGLAATLPLQRQLLESLETALGPEHPLLGMAQQTAQMLRTSLAAMGEAGVPSQSRSERREEALGALPPEREALLAGLDEVPWHELGHAHGPATDVPDLLRLLLAEDEAVRDDAWEHLYSNVWHQGTVYEATAYVVPFLLRMLGDPGPPEAASVLHFLAAIADGSSYLEVHAASEEDRSRWRDILAGKGQDLEAELQQERAWVVAANRAVAEGVPRFLALLEDDDPEVRDLALKALSHLPTRAAEIVPRLRALATSHPEARLRAGAAHALLGLLDAGFEAQHTLARLVEEPGDVRVAYLAAAGLARRAREQTPQAAVDAVLVGLQTRAWEAGPSGVVAWSAEEEPLQLGVAALAALGPVRGTAALLEALPWVSDGEEALDTAGTLLDLVFHDGVVQSKAYAVSAGDRVWEGVLEIEIWDPPPQPAREPASLSAEQREVLAAVLEHDPVWHHQHNLLRLYGLPAERDALRAFVARGGGETG